MANKWANKCDTCNNKKELIRVILDDDVFYFCSPKCLYQYVQYLPIKEEDRVE